MTNKFRFMLLSLAALGIVSCSDKLTDDIGKVEDIGGETGYVSFRIKSADTGGMRAVWNEEENDHFSAGVETNGNFAAEDAIIANIQANRVFFFDKDGNYHSSSFLNLESSTGGHDDDHGEGDNGAYREKEQVYSATVKRVSDRNLPNWPSQCLVILNGRPSRLNALLAKAQADPDFNMKKFLEWVNKDFRDSDVANEGETLGLYKSDSDNKYYFTMSNSVYKGDVTINDEEAGTSTTTKGIKNATQIDPDKLKTTSDLAKQDPITVYVERIMSKVEVGFSGYDDAETETTTGYFADNMDNKFGFVYTFGDDHETNSKWFDDKTTITLKALVTNWTINAVEYQTKLFKEIGDTWSITEGQETPFEYWNDESHHRSYWAIDTHYKWDGGTEYPTQYRSSFPKATSTRPYEDGRELFDNEWTYGESTEEKNGNDVMNPNYPWALDYKSFDATSTKRAYKYCLENTFESDPSLTYQNMIMGSHLLVKARLLSDAEYNELEEKETEAEKVDDAILDKYIKDKYYYSDRYYDEETYIKRQIAVINEVLGENVDLTVKNRKMWKDDNDGKIEDFEFENILGGLWVKQGDKYLRVVSEVNPEKDNEIAATDVFVIAPAYIVKGDGKVTIALKDDNNNGKYGYGKQEVNLYYLKESKLDENGQPVEKIEVEGSDEPQDNLIQFTRNQLVSLIYQVANTADCFKNGRMYYAVPIQHYKAKGNGGDYEIDYEENNTGDYGLVRNHWYKFNINTILKPGVPVHDPDQPIIPNYDEEDRYIGFEVIILPWHIVDNGNVTLGQ